MKKNETKFEHLTNQNKATLYRPNHVNITKVNNVLL